MTSFVILGPRGGQPPVGHVMVAVDSADAGTVFRDNFNIASASG